MKSNMRDDKNKTLFFNLHKDEMSYNSLWFATLVILKNGNWYLDKSREPKKKQLNEIDKIDLEFNKK